MVTVERDTVVRIKDEYGDKMDLSAATDGERIYVTTKHGCEVTPDELRQAIDTLEAEMKRDDDDLVRIPYGGSV